MTTRRIGLFQPYPHTSGGLQRVVTDLANNLPTHGIEPIVITTEAGKFTAAMSDANLPHFVSDPGPAWHLYGRGANSLGYVFSPRRLTALAGYWVELARELREREISLLHCNDYRGVMLAAPAARLAGIPAIWHMHSFVGSRLANLAAAALVNCMVPVSHGMLGYVKLPRRLLGEIQVIHNGVHAEDSVSESMPPDSPLVLAVGRLHPVKGFETLIRAFAGVAAEFPTARCRIVGGEFGDGAYAKQLREVARQSGVENLIEFAGYSEDVAAHMQRCTLLAVPSRVEAFGMVALEAMAAGKPVVAARTGGLQDIVADGETGLLFESENVEAMRHSIASVLRDPARGEAMGCAARARLQSEFTLDQTVRSFAALYRRLLEPAKSICLPWKAQPANPKSSI